MAQSYVGKRPISKGIDEVIRRFVLFTSRPSLWKSAASVCTTKLHLCGNRAARIYSSSVGYSRLVSADEAAGPPCPGHPTGASSVPQTGGKRPHTPPPCWFVVSTFLLS